MGAGGILGLDDLRVGQVFTSRSRRVTAEEMIGFASLYDPQPFHTDPEAAKSTFFAGLAASGWFTAAVSMRLLFEGAFPVEGGVIGAGGELLWPKPVRPGDTLTVECEVLEVRPSRSRPNQASVQVRFTTRNQHGEAVQTFMPRLVVVRPEPAATVDAGAASPV